MGKHRTNNSLPFKPALAHPSLTRLYDPLIGIALRRYNFMERLVDVAKIGDGANVLDLGCGSGRLCLAVKSNHPNCSVVGLDADPEILKLARRKLARHNSEAPGSLGNGVRFVHATSSDMPFAAHTFDRVVSSLLFHHLSTADKRGTFREVRRVLKPGGTLHIVDWGRPRNFMQRLAFLPVQLFDGFDTTSDNVRGLIPKFIVEAGFKQVVQVEQIATPGGTLSIYSARSPA